MTAMDNAVAEFELQEPEKQPLYRKLAAKYNVNRTTLLQR
jgi:DNA-binding transcriptional regulator YhcF (GntR family)